MNETLDQLIFMRHAVGLLGQSGGRAWWACDFLTEVGIAAMDYNFPRAPRLAAFTATGFAAKRLHDDRIGKTGVTHLFRLEPDLEILVHRETARNAGNRLNELSLDPVQLLAELARMAGGEIDAPEGPVQIGFTGEAPTPKGIARLAGHYQAAFRLDLRIFPYFAARLT
jgi:hypothetical protein